MAFDPLYRDQTINIDLRNETLDEALKAISSSTRNFYRLTSQRTVTIVPDTPAKRQEYEEEVVRTFYLSNADLKETQDLLRMVLDARRISPRSLSSARPCRRTTARPRKAFPSPRPSTTRGCSMSRPSAADPG